MLASQLIELSRDEFEPLGIKALASSGGSFGEGELPEPMSHVLGDRRTAEAGDVFVWFAHEDGLRIFAPTDDVKLQEA